MAGYGLQGPCRPMRLRRFRERVTRDALHSPLLGFPAERLYLIDRNLGRLHYRISVFLRSWCHLSPTGNVSQDPRRKNG